MKAPKPSRELVKAAETVFLAMAYTETLRPIVEGYQKEILARHQWPIAKEWSDRVKGDTEIILDPEQSYLLEEKDSAVYLSEVNQARIAAGLEVEKEGYCPLLVAIDLEHQAKRALIDLAAPFTGLTNEMIWNAPNALENKKKAVDLTLRWLAPYVKNPLQAVAQ